MTWGRGGGGGPLVCLSGTPADEKASWSHGVAESKNHFSNFRPQAALSGKQPREWEKFCQQPIRGGGWEIGTSWPLGSGWMPNELQVPGLEPQQDATTCMGHPSVPLPPREVTLIEKWLKSEEWLKYSQQPPAEVFPIVIPLLVR